MHLANPDGWVAVFGSALFAMISAGIFVGRARLQKWKRVPITVTKSGIRKTRGVRDHVRYEPWIHYSYVVDSQSYQGGASESFTPLFSTTDQAESYIARTRNSPNLQGFYNPADPSQSALKRGGLLPVALISAVASLVCLLLAVRCFGVI